MGSENRQPLQTTDARLSHIAARGSTIKDSTIYVFRTIDTQKKKNFGLLKTPGIHIQPLKNFLQSDSGQTALTCCF